MPIGSIATEREASLLCISGAIETIVTSHLQRKCSSGEQHRKSTEEKCDHISKTGHCFQELHRLEVWPISSAMSNKTINDITMRVALFENCHTRNQICGYYSCDQARLDFKKLLHEAVVKAKNAIKGLCLNCVTKGKITAQDGNCRASLLERCES